MTYNPALDGIRALAVIAVLLFHARIPWAQGGMGGVDVFFVLSGYLITRILAGEAAATGTIHLRRFYVRRLRRLYPALLALLATYLVFAPMVFPAVTKDQWLIEPLAGSLYLSDYYRAFGLEPNYLTHLWSLAVEEQFYLLWPLLLLGVTRLERGAAIRVLVVVFIVATAWRAWSALNWANDEQLYYHFDMRLSGLALGGVLGYSRIEARQWVGWLGLAGTIACVLIVSKDDALYYVVGITVTEVAAALLVVGAPAALGRLSWLGKMSYGLYLWHYPLGRWARDLGATPWEQFAFSLVVGLALAAISFHTIEAAFRQVSGRASLDGVKLDA
ncbi:acyltransferase [Pseudoxanthomonas sp. Root630]|uniref:acyltransferase family protein n=1 Tax=Pseudoxanthomonas sp. Root630 TaxID=1736574 RepID=UPI0007034F27|nr:acyltransferase [Pseudoxanthomonas sp. Root630]KRA42874.1 hypothetical protein ASD72_12425 [Pseudoxanthomonas sp. Root630]